MYNNIYLNMSKNLFNKAMETDDEKMKGEKNLPLRLRGSYKRCYVPKIIEKEKRNHYEKKEWVNIYHYISPKSLKQNYEIEFNLPLITDKKFIRIDQMYKDCALSKKSKIYDYYKILKQDLKNKGNIAIEKRRSRFSKNIYLDKNQGVKFHTRPEGYVPDFS